MGLVAARHRPDLPGRGHSLSLDDSNALFAESGGILGVRFLHTCLQAD